MTRSRIIVLGAAIALSVAACSPVERTVEPVGAEQLSEEVSARLEVELGMPVDVVCPDPLPAKVGATTSCDVAPLAASAGDVMVEVVVTSVDTENGIVEFDLTVEPVEPPSEEPADEATEEPTG